MGTDTSPSLEQAKEYIYSVDFSNIINKMVKHQGWLRKDAEKVSGMYRNFLYLNKKYGDQYKLPPSEEIDDFWHNHILDTKKYQQDCLSIFGAYLNHYPYFGIDDSSDSCSLKSAFEITNTLYKQEYGDYISNVRFRFPIRFILKIYFDIIMFFRSSSKPRDRLVS